MADECDRIAQVDVAQHRELTVMFADLVGSTTLARQLDPERYHSVIDRFLAHCSQCIASADGYVARFTGDGVLAYFGYPNVAEDDAVRAIMAALAIREGCKRLARECDVSIDVRCGIASGSAIVGAAIGSGDAREIPVFGDVANLAARLQSAARAGAILVSPETREQTGHRFEFSRSPRLRLNGFPGFQNGWEAVRASDWRQRLPVRNGATPNRLIGREAEQKAFVAAWIEARAGRGSALMLSGEAGIGKSRLIHEWTRRAKRDKARNCVAAADPQRGRTPFQLIVQALGEHATVSRHIEAIGYEPFLPTEFAERVCRHLHDTPALLVFEDIHWADPSSLQVIDALTEMIGAHPILMVVTSRDATLLASRSRDFRAIELGPLPHARALELVTRSAGEALTESQRIRIVQRSGGVPLFVEELVRLVSSQSGGGASRSVPRTLAALLQARLTRLGPAMALAQCAAILGVETPVAALERLAERRGIEFAEGLAALVREELALVCGEPSTIRFRHALYRDAALETLLSTNRKGLYRDAAELFDGHVDGIVPDAALAEFWREAGEPDLALRALDRALTDARKQGAWSEIRELCAAALAAMRDVAASQRGVKAELELQSLLTEALQITIGYSSPTARAAAAKAQHLAERAGEIDQSMKGVAARWMAASSAGDYRDARRFADQVLTLGQLHGGADALAAGHMVDMTTRYRMGDLVGAEAAFRSGTDHFAAPPFLSRTGAIAQTFGNAALIAVLTGDSDVARRRAAHALFAARRYGAAYDRCFAAYMVAMVEILLGADRKAVALGASALRLAADIGFPQFEAIARIVIGRGRAGRGDVDAGVELLRQGLAAMSGTHSRNAQTLYLTWLAEAALLGGDVNEALKTTEIALSINPDELFYRPETLRIRSLALLRTGSLDDASDTLREGLTMAESMRSPWFIDRMKPLRDRLQIA